MNLEEFSYFKLFIKKYHTKTLPRTIAHDQKPPLFSFPTNVVATDGQLRGDTWQNAFQHRPWAAF